ncbi:MAG: hypothetical protein NVSMB1_08630 [Polyangiales bacterium]
MKPRLHALTHASGGNARPRMLRACAAALPLLTVSCGSFGDDWTGPVGVRAVFDAEVSFADGDGDAEASADVADAAIDGDTEQEASVAWNPKGKGLWIWYFEYAGLTAQETAIKAQEVGISYVLFKSGQDASFYSTRYNAAMVNEFTSRGIRVFAWPYVTPKNIAGSINAAVQAAKVKGTSGLVLDVEVEFQGAFQNEAKALCEGIRAGAPATFLGYTSFGWVQYHALPWAAFDTYCGDGFFPQVYWSDRGVSWSFGLDDAIKGIKTVGIKSPIWMIQSNDTLKSGGFPTTADLNAWFDKAGSHTSLWALPSVSTPSKLAQFSELHFRNP